MNRSLLDQLRLFLAGELAPAPPSNFPAMVKGIEQGRGGGTGPLGGPSPFIFLRSASERPFRRAVAALPRDQVEALRLVLCCGESGGAKYFGPAGALAPTCPSAVSAWSASHSTRHLEEWLFLLGRRVAEGLGDTLARDRVLHRRISGECAATFAAACSAFLHAWEAYRTRNRRTTTGANFWSPEP